MEKTSFQSHIVEQHKSYTEWWLNHGNHSKRTKMYRIVKNFQGRKLSWISRICSVPRKFSLRIFWGVACNTWQEYLAHTYSRCHLPFDRLTCPCSSTFRQAHCHRSLMVGPLRGRHPDTDQIQARPGTRRRHGSENGPRNTAWERQFTTSLTWIDRWMKLPCQPCRCSEYRLVLHLDQLVIVRGGCDYRASMRTMSIATPIQIE